MDIPLFSYRTLMQSDFRHALSLSLLEVIPEIHAVLAAWPRREIRGSYEPEFERDKAELKRLGLGWSYDYASSQSRSRDSRITSAIWGGDAPERREELKRNLEHWMTLHLMTLWQHRTIKRQRDSSTVQEVVVDSVHAARDLIETENPAFLPRYDELLMATIDYMHVD